VKGKALIVHDYDAYIIYPKNYHAKNAHANNAKIAHVYHSYASNAKTSHSRHIVSNAPIAQMPKEKTKNVSIDCTCLSIHFMHLMGY
jgi:hypothetical protein